jgi:DNA-binding transcriptional MocR family regulator
LGTSPIQAAKLRPDENARRGAAGWHTAFGRYDTINPERGNRTPQSYREAASASASGAKVKFCYLVPDFANPTGETLSLDARRRTLALSRELNIPVIEDSAYSALRLDGSKCRLHPSVKGGNQKRPLDDAAHANPARQAAPARFGN